MKVFIPLSNSFQLIIFGPCFPYPISFVGLVASTTSVCLQLSRLSTLFFYNIRRLHTFICSHCKVPCSSISLFMVLFFFSVLLLRPLLSPPSSSQRRPYLHPAYRCGSSYSGAIPGPLCSFSFTSCPPARQTLPPLFCHILPTYTYHILPISWSCPTLQSLQTCPMQHSVGSVTF